MPGSTGGRGAAATPISACGVAVEIGHGAQGFLDPLTLQSLYALRRAGSVEVGDALRRGRGRGGGPRGNGRRPRMHVEGNREARPRRITRHETSLVAGRLFALLLVVWKDGRVRPSRVADAFLDGLHACEDVDMPVRWHGRWDRRGGGDADAMDAWIARTFSKVAAGRNRA